MVLIFIGASILAVAVQLSRLLSYAFVIAICALIWHWHCKFKDKIQSNTHVDTQEQHNASNITVHSESNTFTYYITAKLNEIDEKIFVEFLGKIKIKFNIKDKVGKIYEDISGKRNYCYDLDDLVEMLRDKMKNVVNDNSKVLHLHIEPELDTWCRSNGFAKYYNKLKEFGFSSPDEFIEQSQEDVDELCDELEMKYAVKNKLKQAINAVHKEKEEQNKPSQRDFSIVQHTKKQYIVPKSIGIASKTLCASWNSQSLKHPGISHLKQELKHVESKTMLVIGQTGAGKTTLINGMMNYIYNIKYEDNYRLRLIEEKEKQSLQAESQTDHVSVYQVSKPEFDSNIDYDLNIIDTPGFGDTRGILKDAEILVDLTYLLDNTLNGIDAICFVMKSTTNRLTSAQQYVFNSVLNLWSKDIEPNMFILLTFCEGKNAQIINSLVQHPQFSSCKNIFQFNNSAYCHDPTDIKSQDDDMDGLSDQFNKIYWKMSENGFKSFFKVLNDTKPKSTINSRNVLRQRAKIDNKIEIILNEKDNLLHQTQKIVQYQRLIGKYDDEIEYNEDTTQITKHMDMVKEYKNFNTITNCNHCNKTCHSDCKKSDIKNCNVMNEDRCCKICGCHWSEHTNNNYIWVRKQIINKTTNLDIKIKYDTALKNKNKTQNEIQQLLSHKQEIENNIKRKMDDILKDVRYLQKHALRPKLSTIGDYIDQLLQNNVELSNDNLKRLKRIKKKENIMHEIESQWELVDRKRMVEIILETTRNETCRVNECISNEQFICICGNPFEMILAERCYNSESVSCNMCNKSINDTNTMYHCGKSCAMHETEFCLCFKCVLKDMMLHGEMSEAFCGKLNLNKIWKRYDKDGNGIIDQEELEDLIYGVLNLFCVEREPDMPPRSRRECDPFIKKIVLNLKPKLDTHNDGVISREEFKLLGEYFANEYIKLQNDIQKDY